MEGAKEKIEGESLGRKLLARVLKMQATEVSEVTRLTWEKLEPFCPQGRTMDLLTPCPHTAHKERIFLSQAGWLCVPGCE